MHHGYMCSIFLVVMQLLVLTSLRSRPRVLRALAIIYSYWQLHFKSDEKKTPRTLWEVEGGNNVELLM